MKKHTSLYIIACVILSGALIAISCKKEKHHYIPNELISNYKIGDTLIYTNGIEWDTLYYTNKTEDWIQQDEINLFQHIIFFLSDKATKLSWDDGISVSSGSVSFHFLGANAYIDLTSAKTISPIIIGNNEYSDVFEINNPYCSHDKKIIKVYYSKKHWVVGYTASDSTNWYLKK